MSRIISVLREFRDRRMFQILVSYLAAGWVALQVASQLVAHGLVPNVVYIVLLIWFVGGLPGVMMIAWYHGERGDQKAPRLEVFTLSVLGLVLMGMSSVAVSNHFASRLAAAAAEKGMNLQRVAVLYFKDITRGGELQYLADGVTEDLIGELKRVKELDVISRNGVVQFRDADVSQDSIAKALEVGTLVDGTVERVGEQVRINIRLVDALSGAEFQRAAFEYPVDDIFAIRDKVAQETSRFLRAWLGEEIQLRQLARETHSPVAWALYQRAEKTRKDAENLLRHDDHHGMDATFRRADSLLAQAERVDTAWIKPVVLRGFIDYRQARLAHDVHERLKWIQDGLEHAERALQRAPHEAAALELRGVLRYWHWLQHAIPDPDEQARLLTQARADLERAVEIDPTLASAHSALAHLYYREDIASSVLAARRAYEEDAYLEVANEVLWRLTTGSYDLAQFTQAQRWCDEGARRFPAEYRFVNCQLLMMTTATATPDVARAWQLLSRQDSLVPPHDRVFQDIKGRLLVAGVIAGAGLPDSAHAVLNRAHGRISHQVDPAQQLLPLAAYMHTLLDDYDGAIELLKQHAAVNPHFSFEHHWWWQGIRSRPGFAGLRADQ